MAFRDMQGKARAMVAWRPGRLFRGTFALTAGLGVRTLIQATMFILVARILGVSDYGAFSAVLALAAAIGQLGAFGAHTVMLRDVARAPGTFSSAWGRTLGAIALTGPLLLLVYGTLAFFLLPPQVPAMAAMLLGIAEIMFAPVNAAAATAYQAHERLSDASRVLVAPTVPRLTAVLALWPLAKLAPDDVLISWSWLYAASALIAAVYALNKTRTDLGSATVPRRAELARALREGGPFAAGGLALRLYGDIDKTMLGRMDTLAVTGAYSSAYRVAELAGVPVVSLLTAALPRIFRTSEDGHSAALEYVKRLALWPCAYALVAVPLIWIAAPLLCWILGPDYSATLMPLRWLAFLPLVSAPRLLLQNLLLGSDRTRVLVAILVAGAVANILLNLWWIPTASWKGAVISTYAAEILMATGMWIACRFPSPSAASTVERRKPD
jgi:O-antigen/teichoic acid export membrane protein